MSEPKKQDDINNEIYKRAQKIVESVEIIFERKEQRLESEVCVALLNAHHHAKTILEELGMP